jgi:hypothetical protein
MGHGWLLLHLAALLSNSWVMISVNSWVMISVNIAVEFLGDDIS